MEIRKAEGAGGGEADDDGERGLASRIRCTSTCGAHAYN